MGDIRGEMQRGGISSKFKLMVSITILLIGVERMHAFVESAQTGRRVSDDFMVETRTSVQLGQSSSLSHLQSSNEGSTGGLLQGRESVVEGELARRRELFSAAALLYISYGVLSAGHTPCPPRSGRSYYTPNCNSATGPVRPYRRGCSRISRCARG
ncbi:unnamed protein product [Calypogeia fissa]